MVNYWHKRSYAELSTEPGDLAKRGLVYLMSEFFTVNGSASVSFVMETNGTEVQFEFYDITTDLSAIEARLLEDPTYTKFGAGITPRNLNRNFPDASSVTLQSASAVSGGVVIASELLGSDSKAGGQIAQNKVHVLKPETGYVMTFFNKANQATSCHMNLGWAEGEPARYDLIREGINSGGVT
jgi:hypothetical protein